MTFMMPVGPTVVATPDVLLIVRKMPSSPASETLSGLVLLVHFPHYEA